MSYFELYGILNQPSLNYQDFPVHQNCYTMHSFPDLNEKNIYIIYKTSSIIF